MHIKDCVFVDIGVQECCFRIGNFSLKFDCWVMIVRLLLLFNDLFYFVSVFMVPSENMLSTWRFQRSGFRALWDFSLLPLFR